MLSKLRHFYNSKTRREKILLFAVIWAPILVWLSYLNGAQRELSANREMALARRDKAQAAISMKAHVEANLKRAMGDFSESMLVKDLRMDVEGVLRAMQLANYGMSAPEPKVSGRMTIHTVVVTIKSSTLETLADFEKRLLARAPYISMANAEFNTDGRGVMSARYEINSFEFNDKK